MDKLNIPVKDVKLKGNEYYRIRFTKNEGRFVEVDIEKLFKLSRESFVTVLTNLHDTLRGYIQ